MMKSPCGDEIRLDAGWVDLISSKAQPRISSAQQISSLHRKDFIRQGSPLHIKKEEAQPFGWAWWTGWLWVHGPMDRVPRAIGLFRGLKKCPPDTFLPCQWQGRPVRVLYLESHTKKEGHPCGCPSFLVDDIGLEPMTFRTSSGCSSQLS